MAPLDRQQLLSFSSASISSKTAETVESTPPTSPLHCSSDSSIVTLEALDAMPPSPQEVLTPPLVKYVSPNKPQAAEAAAPLRILWGFGGLMGFPILIYKCFPASTVTGNLLVMMDTWDAFLHFSVVYLALLGVLVGVYFGPCILDKCKCDSNNNKGGCLGGDEDKCARRVSRCTRLSVGNSRGCMRKLRTWLGTVDGIAFAAAFVTFVPMSVIGSAPMLMPGWIWYPFASFDSFHIYETTDLAPALQGMCLDQPIHDIKLPKRSFTLFRQEPSEEDRRHLPLCLTEQSWHTLSAGALSSYSKPDVRAVLKGIDYARTTSGGLAIAVLARDVRDGLIAFRQNVEGLQPFFPNKLSVVIFENDSTDGSREYIQQWAQEADGYHVDLMECAEAEDCKFGKKHRDSKIEGGWAKSKAVGDMDVYRQRVTDYITESSIYEAYSHLMVVDIDLAVSLSPFGVLHTLGEQPDNAIASSGRQLFAFSQGTLAPPYDMSAFQPWSTLENQFVLNMHSSWCAIKPLGDRWRNACDPTSSFLMMELLRHDRGHNDALPGFYRVESAFNGAVLYPLSEIRDNQATYDAGEDGQRCEHIGFNLSLQKKGKPMYVNRKWDFHVSPANPGGPSGWRAQNVVSYITTSPTIIVPLVFYQAMAFIILFNCSVCLGVYLIYPLMAPLLTGSKTIQRLISSHHQSSQKKWRIQQGAASEDTLHKLV